MKHWGHVVVSEQPESEPVYLDEAKSQLSIGQSVTYHDDRLNRQLKPARRRFERDTGRALITQTIVQTMDRFPTGNSPIKLLRAPVQRIVSIEYRDAAGEDATMDESEYRLISGKTPARIQPTAGNTWPTTDGLDGAVVVTYVAGYGDDPADVPEECITAIIMLAGHWFDHPTATEFTGGGEIKEVPLGYHAFVDEFSVWPVV